MLVAAPLPCRRPRLSSNVRQQVRRVGEFTNATAEAWPLNAAQERGDSAFLSFSAQGKEDKASRSSRATSLTAGAHRKGQEYRGVSSRHSVSRSRTRRTPSFQAFVPPSSPRSRKAGTNRALFPALANRRGRSLLPGSSLQVHGPASAALQGYVHSGKLLPNPSLEATATGRALGPRRAASYHARRGPSALPPSAPQLKR